MFKALALLCLIAAFVHGSWEGSLKVRFDLTVFGIGTKAFIELPQSNATAIKKGWVQKTGPEAPAGLSSLQLWCSQYDYTVCVFLDDTGYIAGLQVALDTGRYSDSIYDWYTQGFTLWATEFNGTVKVYWTTQQYYISAESLAIDPFIRIAKRDRTKLLQDHAIWVSGFNGKLYEISTKVSDITGPNSDFTAQACIPWMGNHYYYNMTKDLQCRADSIMPWFPLVYSNQLIGVGLVTFGKYTVKSGETNWFEVPNKIAVKTIVPRGPECLYELADKPGLVTMHTYFIRRPYAISCIF